MMTITRTASRIIVSALLAFAGSVAAEAPLAVQWWERPLWTDPERGFNWYPPPRATIPETPQPEEAPVHPKPKSIYEMTSMEEVQKELKRLRDIAILNPTDAHVLDYLKAQTWSYDKSQKFANVATRVAWQNPSVDYNNKSPFANFAIQAKDARKTRDREETMRELAQNHGLFFFARSDCEFCRDQAPVLRYLTQKYGMEVLGISLDGLPLSYFPEAAPDNGVSLNITGGAGIQTVPALYLVSRDSKEIVPVGTGVLSAEEITRRIFILTKTDEPYYEQVKK
jgi:conjugal transfer pilus assembly protein TraF